MSIAAEIFPGNFGEFFELKNAFYLRSNRTNHFRVVRLVRSNYAR